MWYMNPAWYAILISLFALYVSYRTHRKQTAHYRNEERKAKSEVQRSLTQQAVQINEAFVRLGVKGPYSYHLRIPDERVRDFQAKGALLLNQLSMLRDVFQNQSILGKGELDLYAKWAGTILRPWIEADQELMQAWYLSRQLEDLRDPEFSTWLDSQLPIVKKAEK
jgi:hypothetical protein